MLPHTYFDRFREAILNLPVKSGNEKYNKAELMCQRFLLFSQDNLEVYYAPFHHLNPNARLALVGLAPGWTQMEEAFRAARQGLASGLDGQALFEQIDRIGSFSGPMRRNLVEMLDGVGINRLLGIPSCLGLFHALHHLVHFTSVVSAPVFRNSENYRGYGPPLLQVPRLKEFVAEHFAAELASMPQAIIVPLGRVADSVIQFLKPNVISLDRRCLEGFPHPSGANGHRQQDFRRGREQWSRQVAAWLATEMRIVGGGTYHHILSS
jgi:hypothetical protein